MAAFPGGTPTAADLDCVVPDRPRPVFLPNRDLHGASVNSRALELAGIDAATPDPPDGRIERDAAGHPTGTLHEDAMTLAAMFEPYCDTCGCRADHSGLWFADPAMLRTAVAALDAFEHEQQANGFVDHRHHIAHVRFIDPADVPRFRALGVAANLQALGATYEDPMVDLTIPVTGAERVEIQFTFEALARSGATLAMGSDWPVSTPEPWQAIHVAVNRWLDADARSRGPFVPGQEIGLVDALNVYTAGSAYLNHAERTSGTIQVGEVADLAVHDRDPFAGPPEEIAATRAVATYVDGRQMH